jgi:hypothetical protein
MTVRIKKSGMKHTWKYVGAREILDIMSPLAKK